MVAVHHAETGEIIGAGCLVSDTAILTCRHVVGKALKPNPVQKGASVNVRLIGVTEQPKIPAVVQEFHHTADYATDLALLRPIPQPGVKLIISPMEFATPLRHSGKTFFALGFPHGSAQGHHASGQLHGADAFGLVQMDGTSPLLVQDGFSGAPVWSPEVGAFVGLVVAELTGKGVAWCIPSRLLCSFYPDLLVRFRMPPMDRPHINDYAEDDPNIQIFGSITNNGSRKLSAKVDWDKEEKYYTVGVTYKCLKGSPPPRGGYVTFITYPDFENEEEDAYELFAQVEEGSAYQEFYPDDLFTVAAVGDAGDTALTLDLSELTD
ncbi:MAG: trypsin-like peptidase domain-containing protein [Planctomycetes bacterium]|nr:trypsin-like peptidase domain-containing protein [Planctomycetota bacterium]